VSARNEDVLLGGRECGDPRLVEVDIESAIDVPLGRTKEFEGQR
jgi:hypothetical protein